MLGWASLASSWVEDMGGVSVVVLVSGLKTMKQSGVDLVPKMMKQSCSGLVASRGRADLTTSISAIEPTERRSGTNRVARFGRIYGRDKVGEEGEELGRCDGAQTNRR
jgi:hypothetical protein